MPLYGVMWRYHGALLAVPQRHVFVVDGGDERLDTLVIGARCAPMSAGSLQTSARVHTDENADERAGPITGDRLGLGGNTRLMPRRILVAPSAVPIDFWKGHDSPCSLCTLAKPNTL